MPSIRISDIDLESSVQVRARIDSDTVQDYADHILAKKPPLPPIVVFGPDSRGKYFLSEGWHRVEAHLQAKRECIAATVKEGGWKEALEHALGSNIQHGLRRSNADKRRVVELAIKHFEGFSDLVLANKCGVSDRFVREVRNFLQPRNGSGVDAPRKVIGIDGIQRTIPPPPTRPPVAPQGDGARIEVKASPNFLPPPPPDPVEPEPVEEAEEGQLPKDVKGRTIPPDCVPMWERRREILDVLRSISEVRTRIKDAQEDRDPLFCGKDQGRTLINFSSAIAHLNQIYDDVKAALPVRVCPVCQGLGCQHCSGLGLISDYRLKYIPSEYRR
jgi:hypothetical protein